MSDNGYLVLSRRTGESIMIDDDIEILVNYINGGQVKIAIKAPKEKAVHRREIWERIQREKEGCGK